MCNFYRLQRVTGIIAIKTISGYFSDRFSAFFKPSPIDIVGLIFLKREFTFTWLTDKKKSMEFLNPDDDGSSETRGINNGVGLSQRGEFERWASFGDRRPLFSPPANCYPPDRR